MKFLLDATERFIKLGYDVYRDSERFKNLKLCVRQQVERELEFNRELFQELGRTKKNEFPRWSGEERLRLIRALRTSAFDELTSHLLPLDLFFDLKLEEHDHNVVFGYSNEKQPPFYNRVKAMNTQVRLLTKTYQRIHFFKLYEESGGRKPDINYMLYLVVSSQRSLRLPSPLQQR